MLPYQSLPLHKVAAIESEKRWGFIGRDITHVKQQIIK